MDRPLMNTDYTFPVVVLTQEGEVKSLFFTARNETPAELHKECMAIVRLGVADRVVTLPNIPRQVAYQIRRPSKGSVNGRNYDEAVYNALRCYYTTSKYLSL